MSTDQRYLGFHEFTPGGFDRDNHPSCKNHKSKIPENRNRGSENKFTFEIQKARHSGREAHQNQIGKHNAREEGGEVVLTGVASHREPSRKGIHEKHDAHDDEGEEERERPEKKMPVRTAAS